MTTIFLGLGSFDNNDSSGNEDVKKVLNSSLPSLHDYDVKFLHGAPVRRKKTHHDELGFGLLQLTTPEIP